MLTLSKHANACTSPSKSKSCSWRNTNGEPITCAPRRCLTLLFRRLMEAYANAEHVFTWLNTNGHTRTALLMYIVQHNDKSIKQPKLERVLW